MRAPPTFQELRSGSDAKQVNPSKVWSLRSFSNTLSSMDFTPRERLDDVRRTRRPPTRQAGCMAKTEKRPTSLVPPKPRSGEGARLPSQIDRALTAADSKKAVDLVVLDLRKAAGFTDFFVICSGTNARQVRAIADGVIDALAAEGVKPAHLEGYDRSEWVLIDYFDFIVHVFSPDTRLFYGLERLWGSAERIEVPATP